MRGVGRGAPPPSGRLGRENSVIGSESVTGVTDNGAKASCAPAGK
ncbi:hypothetical protein SFR_3285 [Streptomyces sp. FR-008]|nr:hypothetical protein SFR_3285 [Streptomyces sp. FR-008]